MLSTYLFCTTCKSLFSPKLRACPVCGMLVDAGTECRVFRILPHAICSNCGYLTSDLTGACPVCDAPLDSHVMREIVETPVELEIVGIALR